MKRFLLFVFLIISLSFLTIPDTFGISVYSNVIKKDFKPNLVINETYTFFGASNFTVFLDGDLKPYAKLIDPNPGGGKRTVRVILTLPSELPRPGTWVLYVAGSEIREGGGMSFVPQIVEPIYIFVPYTGYYASIALNIPDIELNETLKAKFTIDNRGDKPLDQFNISLEVRDEMNETIFSKLYRYHQHLNASTRGYEFSEELPIEGWGAGRFFANATLYIPNMTSTSHDMFKIGSKKLDILNYPKQLEKKGIVPFIISVKANWKYELDVHAEVKIDGETVAVSPTIQLHSFGHAKLKCFIDTSNLELGNYELKIIAYYGEKGKVEKTSTIEIVEPKPAAVEQPKHLNTTIVLIAALVALAIVIMVFVVVYTLSKNRK